MICENNLVTLSDLHPVIYVIPLFPSVSIKFLPCTNSTFFPPFKVRSKLHYRGQIIYHVMTALWQLLFSHDRYLRRTKNLPLLSYTTTNHLKHEHNHPYTKYNPLPSRGIISPKNLENLVLGETGFFVWVAKYRETFISEEMKVSGGKAEGQNGRTELIPFIHSPERAHS